LKWHRLLSWYFAAGQVLETDRHGPGIYQPSIDQAIDILRDGGWVHIFPEGYVNQPRDYKNAGDYQLLRFKWGVSRILMEAPTDVRILPVYLKGNPAARVSLLR
jgi:monolysocardiolipin acyltransferase